MRLSDSTTSFQLPICYLQSLSVTKEKVFPSVCAAETASCSPTSRLLSSSCPCSWTSLLPGPWIRACDCCCQWNVHGQWVLTPSHMPLHGFSPSNWLTWRWCPRGLRKPRVEDVGVYFSLGPWMALWRKAMLPPCSPPSEVQ